MKFLDYVIMQKVILILIISIISFCKTEGQSKGDMNSIFQNLALMFVRGNRLTISGVAVKGIVKNGKVILSPLASDGTCNTANILATGETDTDGSYSLSYTKTGGIVCLTVSSQDGDKTKVYDEKLKSDIAFPSDSDFKLVTIIPESRIIQNAKKNTNASPFSSMLLKRYQYLLKESGAGADTNSLYKKASREIVIRFGLNKGFSVTKSTRASTTQSVSENDYPELDDIPFDLTKANDPNTIKFVSLMAGFSQLANQYKTGSQVSANDINSVI